MKITTIPQKNIGIAVSKKPDSACVDKNCPYHGTIRVRGMQFTGTVLSASAQKTVTVSWERKYFVKKYDRYQRRYTKVLAHNPKCINAQLGDIVRIAETRPLSKGKHFVVIEVTGRAKHEELDQMVSLQQERSERKKGKLQDEKAKGDQ
ncbi:30S ribosomal protein S17 [Candidatus Woesearchaeota archaeon]|nr:30S ribosomal protein S17 [Candidatus Woesearchaeota archaeon]